MDEHRAAQAERLSHFLRARGLSQEGLAHEAGISVKTISRWVNAKHDPSADTVEAVARALGVKPSELRVPPPEPLGLGAKDDLRSQLGRIEDKLDELLASRSYDDRLGLNTHSTNTNLE